VVPPGREIETDILLDESLAILQWVRAAHIRKFLAQRVSLEHMSPAVCRSTAHEPLECCAVVSLLS
jgi:hypothetical protein